MLTFLLWIVSFLFFTCIGFLFIHHMKRNQMIIYRRVSPFLTEETDHDIIGREDEINNKSLYARILQPQITKIRNLAEGRLPKHKIAQIEKKLQAAGNPLSLKPSDFYILQILLPLIVFLLYLFLFVPAAEEKVQVIFFGLISSGFIYFYTNYYLTAKSRQRTQLIDKALPDFFDLLNVSIEAGLGLDGALKKVCSQMDSPISREFLSTLEDMKLGKSRKEAFIDLRERVPSEFFKSVMTSIIQADQMGLGMSNVLRTQSKRIREKQRVQAKEQAMKAPVKMLLPMVFFIFPTLFIVLLGPVIINLFSQL
jgi:tight adherence protein C